MVSYSDSSVQKNPQRIKIWKHPNQFSNLAEYRKRESFFFGLDDKMLHIWNYHLVFITDSKKKGLGFKIWVSTTLCDPMLTNGMQKLEIKRKKNSVCSKKSPADDKDSKSLHLDLNYSHIKHNFVNIKTIKRCKHKKFTTKNYLLHKLHRMRETLFVSLLLKVSVHVHQHFI